MVNSYTRRNPEAVEIRNSKAKPGESPFVADSALRDTENIPLGRDIEAYFADEILPHVPDAWIDHTKTRIGYEINFTKYFYEYRKPESSAVLAERIEALERDIDGLLKTILHD